MNNSETIRITIDVPKDLLEAFDKIRKRKFYKRRSELIRQLMREYVEQHQEVVSNA